MKSNRPHQNHPETLRRLFRLGLAVLLALAFAPAALALSEGDRAPAFELPALDGQGEVNLSDYRGKVVWLDFWASWCPPCLVSLPQLEKLRREMPAAKFQIIAINVDDNPKKALKFLAKNPVGYPSGSDPQGKLPEAFDLQTMPTSYLIDQNGVIRHVHKGFHDGDLDSIRAEITKLMRSRKK